MVECRPIYEIARDIQKEWKPVNYAARPYLDALMTLRTVNDRYGMDSGSSMLAYFLSNASQFKLNRSKELKAELKQHLSGKCTVLPSTVDVSPDPRFKLP